MIELLVFGGTALLAMWATGAQAHRRTTAARALDRYAQSRGLRFAPAASRGGSPRVFGAKDGVDYVFDLYRLGGDIRTRVTSTALRGRAPVLSVSQRGAFAIARPATSRVGEAAFDAAFVMTSGAAEDAEALRRATAPLLELDAKRSGVWLRGTGGSIALSWRGTESDPLVLDAARDVAVALAACHRSELPYR